MVCVRTFGKRTTPVAVSLALHPRPFRDDSVSDVSFASALLPVNAHGFLSKKTEGTETGEASTVPLVAKMLLYLDPDAFSDYFKESKSCPV